MIPAEAVEAAAKWLHDHHCKSALHSTSIGESQCYQWTEEALELLATAASYMMAQAWDEGVADGQWNAENIFRIDAGSRHAIQNPYKEES